MGQKFRLRIRIELDEKRELQVRFYVLWNRFVRSALFSTRRPILYFVHNASHKTFFSICREAENTELGTGFEKFMSYSECRQSFKKGSDWDSVVFGVMFYAPKITQSAS